MMISKPEYEYLKKMLSVFVEGDDVMDRTGVGTSKNFGWANTYPNVGEVFPLFVTKKVHFKSVLHELIWFIKGDTNIKYLKDNGVSIWDEWADENGDLGPVYGKQWRNFGGVDQLQNLVDQIKSNPMSRRLIVSAWNPAEVEDMALPPCHCFFQVNVDSENNLNMIMYQRSADMFLGLPFNVASYSLLLIILAHLTGTKPGNFNHVVGDCHVYKNHKEQLKEQCIRCNKIIHGDFSELKYPKIKIVKPFNSLDEIEADCFELVGYNSLPPIKAPVAV